MLDTGSSDDTPALARAEGARVAHFQWCDDCAAARNAALAEASADWHIVLDATRLTTNTQKPSQPSSEPSACVPVLHPGVWTLLHASSTP